MKEALPHQVHRFALQPIIFLGCVLSALQACPTTVRAQAVRDGAQNHPSSAEAGGAIVEEGPAAAESLQSADLGDHDDHTRQGPDRDAPDRKPSERGGGDGPKAAPSALPPVAKSGGHGHVEYPEGGDGLPARAVLLLTIDTRGHVDAAEVLEVDRRGEAAEPFRAAALSAAAALLFEPATVGGLPTAARVRYEMLFVPEGHQHGEGQGGHEHEHEHEHEHDHEHSHEERVAELEAVARVAPRSKAASAFDVPGRRLRNRPYRSAGDLLNAASGFYSIQHAGGGKAQQFFLRGFDADHGTDIAFFVDGVPVNAVSHGHGQGFSDLHWVIPELVERIEVRKGPYYADLGDFATAGSARYVLARRLPQSFVSASYGSFDTGRLVVAANPELTPAAPIFAAEVYRTDGPFNSAENARRINLFARSTHAPWTGAELTFTATGYSADWNASGQIPARAVESGQLDRFGSVDPAEGGDTQRASVFATLQAPAAAFGADQGEFTVDLWLARYRFDLYSNFTFYSLDPERGDMIHQGDRRTSYGLSIRHALSRASGAWSFGMQTGASLRADEITNSLDHAPDREHGEAVVDAEIDEHSIGLHVQTSASYRDDVRLVAGLRSDFFDFNVLDRLEDRSSSGTRTSGQQRAARVSPKASLILSPLGQPEWLETFASIGLGFHSNDARAIVANPDTASPLTRALGYELGLRTRPTPRLNASLAGFVLELDSELVWVGDEGTTEASGRSRRMGIEGDVRLRPLSWLTLELQAQLTEGLFVDAPDRESAIPLAPRLLMRAGIEVEHAASGLWARLGVVHVGDRPATEDEFLTAEGFTRTDLGLGWDQEHFGLALRVQNLLDAAYRQAQFATVSRLPGEGPGGCTSETRAVMAAGSFLGCEDVNFTPGPPIDLQLVGTLRY